jgi:hypothetical protein
MIGVPEFAAAQMAAFLAPTPRHGHGPVQGKNAPAVSARQPATPSARQSSEQAHGRSAADDIACRVLDAGEGR